MIRLTSKPLPERAAKGLGARFAVFGAGRTFELVAAGRGRPTTGDRQLESFWKKVKHQFRPPVRKGRPIPAGMTFIEKTKYAIDMPKEKLEIPYAGIEKLRLFPELRKRKRKRRKKR